MSALTFAAAQLLRVLPRRGMTRLAGRLADHRWRPPVRRAVVGLYTRAYGVELRECAEKNGWVSFDAFFTRALREGVRPLAPPPAILSPADGRLESMGRVESGGSGVRGQGSVVVKGRPYSVEELVGDAADARRYDGGGSFVVYLSPRDYHRVHSPATGTIACVRSMPGDYYPVNAIGVRHVPSLFVRNRRVALAIDTQDAGRVTVVMVAAMVVGRITVTAVPGHDVELGTHAPRATVRRGDEIGRFHLGSTVVVLLEDSALDRWLAREGAVRYGQAVAEPRAKGRLRVTG